MHERAEGKDEKPGLPLASIEVYSGKGDGKEKHKGVGKYPAIAEDVAEEDLAYGLIDNVGKKRAHQ